MNIKNVLTTALITGAFLAAAGVSYADGSSQCQIVYGGGQVCQQQIKFTIDKKVMQPTKGGGYVDNLTINDAHFQAGGNASFQITLTNTGSQTINQLTVVDTLPSYLTFVAGPGTYNADNHTITYTISNLEVGKSDQQTYTTAIADQKTLPQNQNVICLNNNVTGNDNNGDTASDTSSLCVENPVTPTSVPTPKVFGTIPPKSVPNTGPEMLPLLGLIPAGLSGLFLRRKSKLS